MSDKNLRSKSRENYLPADSGLTLEQINVGSLQRIADATELVAKNYRNLQDQVARLESYNRSLQDQFEAERRSNNALRGVITKLRKGQSHG